MFSEKVCLLQSKLNANNIDIANFSGCNASNISRLRTGARIPKQNSPTIKKFIDGIYSFAIECGKISILCSLCKTKESDNEQIIKSHVCKWLYDDSNDLITTNGGKSQSYYSTPFSFFGEKLNAAMNLIDISNVRLGKMINLDPSYISRFRGGVRTPKAKISLVKLISETLADRIEEQQKKENIALMMNIKPSSIQERETFRRILFEWLCDFDTQDNDCAIDNLLESIDTFSPDVKEKIYPYEEIVDERILNDNADVYYGTEGLRTAVIRFLVNAINNNEKELLLYSDQDMGWMIDDKLFQQKWMSLMSECVRNGIRIRIIHNIDRDLSEMVKAIESWMPLYMSGMIEPYSNKKNNNSRFSHTLFICPNTACIQACNLKGFEDKGLYSYHTDLEHILVFKQEYLGLLNLCEPLIKIFTEYDRENFLFMSGMMLESRTDAVLNSLSIASMSEDLIKTILERNNIEEKELERILEFWRIRHNNFIEGLNNGHVYEFIPIANDDELFAGKVAVELGSIMSNLKLYYTVEEYGRHIQSIMQLLEKYSNYRLYILPETPFTNMQIIIEGNNVIVIKTSIPRVAFVFSNPLMKNAFCEYVNRIKVQYKHDRVDVSKKLMKFL